ncbi:hypothetical protein AWB85_20070 [Mycobacteroides immunogenum]|uniref:Uncharacterized protein n=1 Tax=Mycobacteroides immunogenum TaxID=83262 RepID=A0A179VCR3_9MYCO|nr:hypothetical protein AWB85_20070 [Mycobacteroides immunogenum]
MAESLRHLRWLFALRVGDIKFLAKEIRIERLVLVAITGHGVQGEDGSMFTLSMNAFHAQRELKPPLICTYLPVLYDYLST